MFILVRKNPKKQRSKKAKATFLNEKIFSHFVYYDVKRMKEENYNLMMN